MSNPTQLKGANILICGSQQFDSPQDVMNSLNMLYSLSNGRIRKIFTSRFSGACEYARKWAESLNRHMPEDKKVEIVDYYFDNHLNKKNNQLYNQIDLPEFAIKESSFFQEAKEMLIAKGVNVVLAFPNKEGVLGASTLNITRAAELASIKILDCSKLIPVMEQKAKEMKEGIIQKATEEKDNKLGLKNRHPLLKP